MTRHDSMARRSASEWSVRLLLALIVAAAGYIATTYSLAQTSARQNLLGAHRLAPYDGRISARLAGFQFTTNEDASKRDAAARLAGRALRQEPTAIAAVTTLGFDAQIHDDVARSRQWFAYAQKLSRRDFTTQLWAIEDAVGRGYIAGAVHHYDIALRTSRTAPDVLYPVLANAIDDQAVRAQVLATLKTRPIWAPNFITYVSVSAAPQTAAALFSELMLAGAPVSSTATASVVDRLIAASLDEDAWHYYKTMRRGADRKRLRDPKFTAELPTPSVFDWQLTNNEGISTSIQRNGASNLFDFSVAPSTGGMLIAQRQMLPAGRYAIRGHSIGIEQSSDALPYWTLTCPDGRELIRLIVPNSASANGNFTGTVVVPSGCPVQQFALIARPSGSISGLSGQIDHVDLRPVL